MVSPVQRTPYAVLLVLSFFGVLAACGETDSGTATDAPDADVAGEAGTTDGSASSDAMANADGTTDDADATTSDAATDDGAVDGNADASPEASSDANADADAADDCTNGVKDGTETGIDCGGSCGACFVSACANGSQDGLETDVDCGGNCGACADQKKCAGGHDCASGVCAAQKCVPATCADGAKNGTETDVDCGGACGPCILGKACGAPADCETGSCAGTCQLGACHDGVQNGTETDVDCGGPSCGPCGVGNTCSQPSDCASGTCSTVCTSATGFSGGAGTTNDPYLIYSAAELDEVRNHLTSSFKLMANLSLAGSPWTPIGTTVSPFKGDFDGNHRTIDGLVVGTPGADDAGLFGAAFYATHIKNLTLTNASVSGRDNVGIVVGSTYGAVNGVHVTGSVSGRNQVGGLVGSASSGNTYDELQDDVANVTVDGDSSVGGLVGVVGSASVLLRCRATGAVIGKTYVGGLAGRTNCGNSSERCIYDSSATGNVTGQSYVGGLTGLAESGASIERSFATGTVTAGGIGTFAGGLIGRSEILVANVYATGTVVGSDYVGGLIGQNASLLAHAFSRGPVTGTSHVGGLVGGTQVTPLTATVDGYWDTVTSTQATSAGGTGKTTAEMQTAATFGSWDDASVWTLGAGYPSFRSTPKACVVGAAGFDGGAGKPISPFLVASAASFYNIRCNLNAAFRLTSNVDFGGKANVPPVGSLFYKGGLAGSFDGNHKKLSNWTYFGGGSTGIFGFVSGGGVKDITVENIVAGGSYNVGTLVGFSNAPISGARAMGGSVRSIYVAGGLVGQANAAISKSMADVPVTAASSYVGGFVGFIGSGATVTDSYAWGATTGPNCGSFVGGGNGSVVRTYGKGLVTSGGGNGFGYVNGGGTATDSYWDITTTGQATSPSGIGKTDAQMKTQATFVGWDFTNVWQMGGSGYPELR